MQLANQQASAVDKIAEWYTTGDTSRPFYLAGWAGTGKTTLAKYIAEILDIHPQFLTYTGKAASVLRRKGNSNATTIHSRIYRPQKQDSKRTEELRSLIKKAGSTSDSTALREDLRKHLAPRFSLVTEHPFEEVDIIFLDECSMVDKRVASDLESFRVPIIILGDPGQLPPVGGEGYYTGREPDVMLTDIHRQALDNPIIQLASQVREGRRLKTGNYGESKVLGRGMLSSAGYAEADQVLVGRNATRRGRNRLTRLFKGVGSDVPISGDKLICLKNNHNLGLLNGEMWGCLSIEAKDGFYEFELKAWDEAEKPDISIKAHTGPFNGEDLSLLDFWQRKQAEEFDYGYAITVHKSQGSSWPSVVIQDEAWCFREHADKWLYTAITRAEDKVTIVK